MTRPAVTELSTGQWQRLWDRTTPLLPFGDLGWTRLRRPDRIFSPVLLSGRDGPDLLVPLCLTRGRASVIGTYGYGFVQPGDAGPAGWPGFAELAEALCEEMDVTSVGTVLPPAGVCRDLDAAAEGWGTRPDEDTYLVRLDDGLTNVWSRIAKSHQRNIRRAQRSGVRTLPGRRRHLPAVLELYRSTMENAGLISVYEPDDLAFLFDADRADAVVMVAEQDGEVVAAEVTAVAGRAAFYMIGTVSERGRELGAGHLTLWAAMERLTAAGVETFDLGPSTGSGQDAYKRRWGSTVAPIRVIQFPGNSD